MEESDADVPIAVRVFVPCKSLIAAPHLIKLSHTRSGGNRGGLADDGEREDTDNIEGVLGFIAKAEMAEEVHGNANVG